MSPDGTAMEFGFLDVVGNTRGGYLKDMTITMIDANQTHSSVYFRHAKR